MSKARKIFKLLFLFVLPISINLLFLLTIEKTIIPDINECSGGYSMPEIYPIKMYGFPLPYMADLCWQGNSGECHVNWINLSIDFFVYLALVSSIFYLAAFIVKKINKWFVYGSYLCSILLWLGVVTLLSFAFGYWDDLPGWYENYKSINWTVRFFLFWS